MNYFFTIFKLAFYYFQPVFYYKTNNFLLFSTRFLLYTMQTEIHILSMTNEESRINTPVTNQQRRDLIEKYSLGGFHITDAALLTNIEYDAA